MNLQHLKYAVEVQRTGSISQAAENLYMGQPNLSKAIKELESQLGVTLFERSAKGVVPTQKGLLFLSYARSILKQLDEITALCGAEEAGGQQFGIAVPRASYIATAFTDFVKSLDHSGRLEVNFLETNSTRTIRKVTDGEFRIGIIRYYVGHEPFFLNYIAEKGLEHRLIWEFDYLALMSRNHPLAGFDAVDADGLEEGIELVHGDLSVPYLPDEELRRQRLRSGGRRIYVYERGSQFDLLARVPGTYMWVSPVPRDQLERNGLVQRPCAGQDRRCRDALIHRSGYELTALDRAFLDELERARDRAAAGD